MISGRTNDHREDFVLIEKKQPLLPAHGLSLVTGTGALTKGRAVRTSRRARKGKASKVPSLPPKLEIVTTIDVVRRFNITSTMNSAAITRGSLIAIVGAIVTVANTTTALIASGVRLRRIICWPAVSTAVTISVPSTAAGAEQALSKESQKSSALPTGITVDQPVVFRPKRGTYLDMWQAYENQTDQLLAVSASSGGVIDVHLVATIAGAVSQASTRATTSTVSLSAIGYYSLDINNKTTVVGVQNFLH